MAEEIQTVCDACGGPIEPRPSFDSELRPPGLDAPLVAPAAFVMPRICGTAMLTIARIGELRRFAERCVIAARRDGGGVTITIAAPAEHPPDLEAPESTRIGLPAQLDVGVRGEGEPHRPAAASVTLHAASTAVVRIERAVPDGVLVIVLQHGDALHEVRVAPA